LRPNPFNAPVAGHSETVSRNAAGGDEEQRAGPDAPTAEELKAQEGRRVPKREAMSIIDAGMENAVHAAIAVNLETDDAVDVDQS
jgi:hypothetical protein